MSKPNLVKKYDYILVSPHLDDTVVSLGGFIKEKIQKKLNVLVITVFTKAETPKNLSNDQLLFLNSQNSCEKLFNKRKLEDKKVADFLGFDLLHLDFTDALFRQKNGKYLYPEYKKIFSGKINKLDSDLILKIKKRLKNLITKKSKRTSKIFSPLGVGKHVDHVIVAELMMELISNKKLLFWEDIPYRNQTNAVEETISSTHKNYKQTSFTVSERLQKLKMKACKLYKTQFKALEKNGLGDIDYKKEVIYQ
jgi:LmbE family N-acetylglucosaminyl deacetylase